MVSEWAIISRVKYAYASKKKAEVMCQPIVESQGDYIEPSPCLIQPNNERTQIILERKINSSRLIYVLRHPYATYCSNTNNNQLQIYGYKI